MAQVNNLPCDGDGMCMVCKETPPPEESITCNTCATPWHANCLSSPPGTLADTLQWACPDCTMVNTEAAPATGGFQSSNELVASIRAIELDESLTELEKAKKRQELLIGKASLSSSSSQGENSNRKKEGVNADNDILDGTINCSFCMQLPERPVTTPCGHNFCLRCFQKWIRQGKNTCINCRTHIPKDMARQPRINSALVVAIRMAKATRSATALAPQSIYHYFNNQDRPDQAFTTERAKKAGLANASSGKIFVTVAEDHFGPILAENDPLRKQGVLVGESWLNRMSCRQWGIHRPHVAGIAGQSAHGAQSVVLSGGYEDDEDHGEWFLYTGSGGRDLSGNKRTNKEQSFDQQFEKLNEALRVSCNEGYPVRVVRSHNDKHSSYAPETGIRYDGVYRIEKCWRKNGKQGHKVCRYLFVRCDNEPAPWTSDSHGDLPRPMPLVKELEDAIDITERSESPSWDYDVDHSCWTWKKPPPASHKKPGKSRNQEDGKRMKIVKRQQEIQPVRDKLPKELICQVCQNVMTDPVTTPCGHNFCKVCLEGAFAGQSHMRERTCQGRRTLRAQKNIMKCPSCTNDIADFLQNLQVNNNLMELIEALQQRNVKKKLCEDCSKKNDGTCEKPEAVASTEICNADGQEEPVDNPSEHQAEDSRGRK